MNINQKSIAVLSSPYLFAISQVGAALATLAGVTVNKTVEPYAVDQIISRTAPASDGNRSITRETINGDPLELQHCSTPIPANRVNRKDRRAFAKFERRNPTIKAS